VFDLARVMGLFAARSEPIVLDQGPDARNGR